MTTTKKTAQRPQRRPAQRPPELEETPEVVDLDENGEAEYGEIPVFTLKGKTYSITDKPRANLALKSLWLMKTHGEDNAMAMIVPEVLGDELMAILMDHDGLTTEQLGDISKRVMQVVFKQAKDDEGN
ncbi:hypothetical protein [Streptomyces californicus]|uniref:hypothetical protein n=1 Tax=Streptomyces californicus TaxID=67351 RepID=UPI0033E24D7C